MKTTVWPHHSSKDSGSVSSSDIFYDDADHHFSIAACGSFLWQSENLAQVAKQSGVGAALAEAYRTEGLGMVGSLRGSFALVLVDFQQQRILAATDRFGTIPVFYRSDGQRVFVATDLQDIAPEGAEVEVSPQAIFDYCYFHVVPAPLSIIPETSKLPAAHQLLWANGARQVSPYWTPDFNRKLSPEATANKQHELQDLLRNSVQRCLVAAEKPGAFLSGGLDSSTVVGMMAENGSEGQAYTIGFDADGYDEMPYARLAAEHFGVKLNEYYLTPEDIVDSLPLLARNTQEPFGNSSLLPAYYCARMAERDGVDVMLAGDGGDELFAGNERYLHQRVFRPYGKLPRAIRHNVIEPLADRVPASMPLINKLASYVKQAKTPLPERLQTYNFLHRFDLAQMFQPSFLSAVDTEHPSALLRELYQRPLHGSELDRMLYHDWQVTLADNDLRKVYFACRMAGVHVAYPMLDTDLADFSIHIPDEIRLKKGRLRAFYKAGLKGWLPDATLKKTKQGFGLPFGVWMREHRPLQELVYDSIAELRQRNIIQPAFLDESVKLHREGHASYYGELLWILTYLELWLASR
ncbi:asparagine synthetase B family protein [Sediminihaliea albiluteola]|uniref:asparagine synthetase B family protein n=1 Tax=Sediminihaliea albiluteola TaxID=2758564 RepID=UPI001C71454C|nr:asparagine synthase C-terminal domain-containing protein [Sediminihaliea albiluteola]